MNRKQRLFVLSGPSGCGKATLLKYVTDHIDIKHVVTYTTRKPRPGEVDGKDYHFVSPEEFNTMHKNDELIETEKVYGDYYYGSPRNIFSGTDGDVIMELDTKGTANYRKIYDNIITIFILPPSIEELVERIKMRYPETNFRERLQAAKSQLESVSSYDYLVINDAIDRAGREILQFITTGKVDEKREEKLQLATELCKSEALRS